MNRKIDPACHLSSRSVEASHRLQIRIRPFQVPLVQDGLVLGRRAAVGCYALRKALHLLTAHPFVHIEMDDEIISDLIVRESVLLRCPRDWLVSFVLEQIKPLMKADEILQLAIEAEVVLTVSSDRPAAT